jgi:hypothetical protein
MKIPLNLLTSFFSLFMVIASESAGSAKLDGFQGLGVTVKAWVFRLVYRAFIQYSCKLSLGCMYIRISHDRTPYA